VKVINLFRFGCWDTKRDNTAMRGRWVTIFADPKKTAPPFSGPSRTPSAPESTPQKRRYYSAPENAVDPPGRIQIFF